MVNLKQEQRFSQRTSTKRVLLLRNYMRTSAIIDLIRCPETDLLPYSPDIVRGLDIR